jgi:hypothetical protein
VKRLRPSIRRTDTSPQFGGPIQALSSANRYRKEERKGKGSSERKGKEKKERLAKKEREERKERKLTAREGRKGTSGH